MEVLGYHTCRLCPNLVLRETSRKTGGVCDDCFKGGNGVNLRVIELVGRGYRIRVPARKRRPKRPQPRHPDHHQSEKAKANALKRLKAIFPDLYDTLVAEERARLGLHPWPTEMAVRYGWDPDCHKTIEFARVYHALDQDPR